MRLLLLFVLFASLAACSNAEVAGRTDPTIPPRDPEDVFDTDDGLDPEDVVSGVGTIRYIDLEGGFYGLVADDSTRYNPTNLEDAFKEDGLRVRFRGAREDVMTIQMWGTPLRITNMLRLD